MSRGIVGVLLAAGQSTRFGTDKLLHPLADGTVLALAAARHLLGALPDSVAVVQDASGEVAQLLGKEGLRILVNRNAIRGMGSSIACGVAASRDADGWVIALADMPCIPEPVIRKVAAGLTQGSDIVAPVYRGRRGHPVGFSRRHAEALTQLQADEGARGIIAMHPDATDLIEVQDPGVIIDVDDARDLAQLQGD